LLDPSDALAHHLRSKAVFYIVPNMNPDGSVRGHLRCNAVGANLNREWAEPTMERSPEVYLVKQRMADTGVALCLDVHGDEALPYNFIAGPDGVEALPEHVLTLRDRYSEALQIACPDFQRQYGYPKAAPGKANLTMCTNQTAHAFGAVSMTLEQPFKDNADRPDPEHGWSPARCRALGRAQLDALAAVIDPLAKAR
jgi:murein tripeptide amidase MpaA